MQPNMNRPKRRLRQRALVAAIGVVLGGSIACGDNSDNQFMDESYETETAIRTTAVQLFEAMSRNDWDRYNELQCAKQRSDTPVDPGLAEKMANLEVIGVNVTDRTDTTAEVDVEFHDSDEPKGANHTESIAVIREGGEWVAC